MIVVVVAVGAAPLPVSVMFVFCAELVMKSVAVSCAVVEGVNVTVIMQTLFPAGGRGDDVEHVVVSPKSAALVPLIPTAAKYKGTVPVFDTLMGVAVAFTPSG